MVRRGLGRGLEAFFPPEDMDYGEQVVAIDVESIDPNPRQPRQRLNETSLEELATSIQEHGVVQPIVVCRNGERYQLVTGERRWRACRLLGMKKVPAVIKELNDRESTEVALVENIQREDLNALEEANAYRLLQEEFSLTQEEVAHRVGKSRAQVANTLRLLHLPEEIQGYIAEGLISAGHGRALLTAGNVAQQVGLADQIVKKGLSVREAEELAKKMAREEGSVSSPRKRPSWDEWENVARSVAERLGTRVRVRGKDGRGRIEVEFYSLEELDRLLEVLGVE